MDIPLDEVIYVEAIASGATGVAVDADSTPTFAVYEESTDTEIGVGGNMTKRTSLTGNYRASFTASAANGFEVGKWYSAIGSATISAIATKGVLKTFRIVAAEALAGYPKVDVGGLGGDTQSMTDLKDFADAGYDPATNKVQGVVLVDECTENTDMRGTDNAALAAVWTATLAAALSPIRSNTAQAGSSTTITLDASASAVTNFYVPCGIYLTGGAGAGQFRTIDDYNGTTKVADVSEAWYVTPDNTTTFAIHPKGIVHADMRALGGNELSAGYLKAIADYYGINTKIQAQVEGMNTDAISADSVSAAAVTKIQSGLATASELLLVKDRTSYCLTVLVGACADAGTAAETYVHAIGGETFTAEFTGLDATGNRTTTTLSKV